MNHANNSTNNVLGWFLADEVKDPCGTTTKPSLSHFTSICQAAHNAQTANQNWPNKPFYIVIYMDGNWNANNQSLNFSSYVDPWVNAVTNTVGAELVIMIDYYPWLSTACFATPRSTSWLTNA